MEFVYMELRQLRYLIGIAEAGGVLAASKTLHVAQPALSQHVASLEQELGVTLFLRSHRGMTLTDVGKAVVERARVVLQDVERVTMAAHEGRGIIQGDVVVGLPTTVALVATLPILQAARDRYPGIRLKLIESHTGFLGEWLESGRLDFAFLFAGPVRRGIVEQPVLEERLVFVTREPLAGKRRISLESLAKHPLVLPARGHGLRQIVEEACLPIGVELHVIAEIDSLPNIKRAVEAGMASTILSPGAVSEEVANGRLAVATISRPELMRRVVCATAITRPRTAAASALIELSIEVVRDMVASSAWPARWID